MGLSFKVSREFVVEDGVKSGKALERLIDMGFPLICGSLKNVQPANPEQVAQRVLPTRGGAANTGAAKTGRFPLFGKVVSIFTRQRNEVPRNNGNLNQQTFASNSPIKVKLTIKHNWELNEAREKFKSAKVDFPTSPEPEPLGKKVTKSRCESCDSLDMLLGGHDEEDNKNALHKGDSYLKHLNDHLKLKTETAEETGSQSRNIEPSDEEKQKTELSPAEQEIKKLFKIDELEPNSLAFLNKTATGKKPEGEEAETSTVQPKPQRADRESVRRIPAGQVSQLANNFGG